MPGSAAAVAQFSARSISTMHARKDSESSSHTDSLFSYAATSSTSSTLIDSTSDLLLSQLNEHATLHLDYSMPIFCDLSEPPSPSSPTSFSSASHLGPDESSHNLISGISSVPLAAPKPRLWLHRRRRRTSSTDTRVLLNALFHSRWPRTEPEDPIFGQTAPRALSPTRAQHLRGDETVTPSRLPTPRPAHDQVSPAARPGFSPKMPPTTPSKSDPSAIPPPLVPTKPAAKPRSDSPPLKSILVSPQKPSSPKPQHTSPSVRTPSPHPSSNARPSSPAAPAVATVKSRGTSPRPRPHSAQSMPRSILRSDSRLCLAQGRTTPCSVTFAARAGVRVYDANPSSPASSRSTLSSDDGADVGGLNWYQRREKAHREWDTDSSMTYPPARQKKDSFFRRCFGGNSCKEKEKGPLVISGPMPLARAASLRDMRSAREEAASTGQSKKDSQRAQKEKDHGKKLRKPLPTFTEEQAREATAPGVRRMFWGRKPGV